jgi:hypothetical protein
MNYEKIVKDNLVLKIRCGSHLFGTNTPESDLDLTGIFMPAPQMVYGFAKCETLKEDVAAKDESGRNTADAVDCTYYEYRFFIKLAMENNPNIMHLLFANDENVLLDEPKNFGRDLLNHAHLFPHKGGHHRFVKYADGQRHKMRIKPENYAALQGALEFLKVQDPHAVLGEFRDNRLFVGEPEKGKHLRVGDLYFEPGVYAKKACKMIEERLSKATHRSALFTKYGYDTKFASNVIHLLKEGIDLMRYGRLVFPLPYAQEIVDIKQGRYELEQIQEWADRLVEEARRAFEQTTLPAHPRIEEIEALVMSRVRAWQDRSLR